MYDSTYMRYLESKNSKRQKVEQLFPGAQGRENSDCLMATEFQFCNMKRVLWTDGSDGSAAM